MVKYVVSYIPQKHTGRSIWHIIFDIFTQTHSRCYYDGKKLTLSFDTAKSPACKTSANELDEAPRKQDYPLTASLWYQRGLEKVPASFEQKKTIIYVEVFKLNYNDLGRWHCTRNT